MTQMEINQCYLIDRGSTKILGTFSNAFLSNFDRNKIFKKAF